MDYHQFASEFMTCGTDQLNSADTEEMNVCTQFSHSSDVRIDLCGAAISGILFRVCLRIGPMRSVPRSASHVRSDMYRVSAVSTAVLWITPDLRSALFR